MVRWPGWSWWNPEQGRVVDLAGAERRRLERRGATSAAARRLAAAHFPGSLRSAIEQGETFLEHAAAADDALLALSGLTWLPAADPTVLRDFIAFEQRLVNASARLGTSVNPLHYERPGYYKGSVAGLIGHEATVRWAAYTQERDYELELGMVFGRGGHDLDPEEAVDLFGIACFNDISARDIQAKEKALGMGPAKAKNSGSALAPWVTTIDKVPLEALEMRARVNGEEWSRGSTADLMWRP